jgi:chromosome segregation ATPase
LEYVGRNPQDVARVTQILSGLSEGEEKEYEQLKQRREKQEAFCEQEGQIRELKGQMKSLEMETLEDGMFRVKLEQLQQKYKQIQSALNQLKQEIALLALGHASVQLMQQRLWQQLDAILGIS